VTFGWVGRGVFYARYGGSLSGRVGIAYAARLAQWLLTVSSLVHFSDTSELRQYDLMARSAFTRLVFENRRKFSKLVMLTWSSGATSSAQAFAASLGASVTLLENAIAFEQQLVAEAPLARQMIDSRPWVNQRPPLVAALK
jgi:hypothetical protein